MLASDDKALNLRQFHVKPKASQGGSPFLCQILFDFFTLLYSVQSASFGHSEQREESNSNEETALPIIHYSLIII